MFKEHCAEKYDLDFLKMNDRDYKLTTPAHLHGLTVRDVLIKEGNSSREIWKDVWANHVYKTLLNSNEKIGLISDFRFPNEFDCFERTFEQWKNKNGYNDAVAPKITKILVYRYNGVFATDGADNELPDLENEKYWDYIVYNKDNGTMTWKDFLKFQVYDIMKKEGVLWLP